MSTYPKPPEVTVTGYPASSAPPPPPPFTASTAYPYPAPPPPPYAAPYHHPYQPYQSPYRLFLRPLMIIAAAVLLAAGITTFIVWLVIRPRLPEFSVSSASVSGLSTDAQSLTASFNVAFSVRNPSKKAGIGYDGVEAAVFYGGDSVVKTTLPPLYQGSGNSTIVRARLVAVGTYVPPGMVKGIADDRAAKGTVSFGFAIRAAAYFRSGAWRPRQHLLTVYCDGVPFRFANSTAGVFSGPQKPCKVYFV
ncbi:hypothetical protein QJS10_CPA08g01371 [Acorus calamus]|uniref:Late embryogenesis abundant protein LEA-2 subgroup domain-containing protein n=1 Tax=Acorus calamus TaxID=4465 RepID=A0AAV9E9L2_ACOCL|nr:hypothetical protein QJS10_CPA08g01371 [Acorus calamus]